MRALIGISDLLGNGAGHGGGGVEHAELVDVVPEGAEGEVEVREVVVDDEEVGVDEVVVRGAGELQAAVVGPGAGVHGRGGGEADVGVLAAGDGDGIVEVVG